MSIFSKISGLFSGNGSQPPHDQAGSVEYSGFIIQPTPKQDAKGWSTEATIQYESEGQVHTHHFIRADTSVTREEAIALIVSKARVMIDQVGVRMFDSHSG